MSFIIRIVFNNNYCLFCTRILALTENAAPAFKLVEASVASVLENSF
jgi:hypothetical protein